MLKIFYYTSSVFFIPDLMELLIKWNSNYILFIVNKMSIWQDLSERWKNSIVHLFFTKSVYDYDKPFLSPQEKKTNATGFIVDIQNGIIITNEHVVRDANSIFGRTFFGGQQNFAITVHSVCREKDIALCKFTKESLQDIKSIFGDDMINLNMQFSTNYFPKYNEKVMSLGYPINEDEVKFTVGAISGFNIRNINLQKELVEDSGSRSPIYFQTTAALNPGNSGGPIINNQGHVIGVTNSGIIGSQLIGYAINSKTVLAIYPTMLKETIVCVPTLGIGWLKPTEFLLKEKVGEDSDKFGIYIRKIFDDSCLTLVHCGDIITDFQYIDSDGNTIIGIFDPFGDIFMYSNGDLISDRRLNLSEFVDCIPIDSNLRCTLYRNKKKQEYVFPYSFIPSDRVTHLYPTLIPMQYCIFAGLCLMNLSCDHLSESKRIYDKCVIVTHIFPETLADQVANFELKCKVVKINGIDIHTINDVIKVRNQKPLIITIETSENACFMISQAKRIEEDINIAKKYNLKI